jgi:aconitate hydratase
VKSSLAPGSKVVTEYYDRAGLSQYLDELGFDVVGYGCTTCIGNSGPLREEISSAVDEGGLVVCSVLSGNRNFEARIHPEVKANYLASPPLVVAYALAGRMDLDLTNDPLGQDEDGNDVFLSDVWPSPGEVQETIASALEQEMFTRTYADVFTGDDRWRELDTPEGELFAWEPSSTYVRLPPYFEGMSPEPGIRGRRLRRALPRHARRQRHDRPHLARRRDQAGQSRQGVYLTDHGVERKNFNSYGRAAGTTR